MMSSIIAMVFSSQLYAASPQAVLTHYADLAEAMYGDSLTTARSLQKTVNTFIAAQQKPICNLPKQPGLLLVSLINKLRRIDLEMQ